MNLERSADGEYRFLRFDRFMAEALYGVGGFFQSGGQAGGSDGDFLTSPETGALFGRLWGRALDRFWEELGRPDPFVVIEAGAGVGTLARSVLRSQPECGSALALHLVEASQHLADQARARLDQFPNVVVHRSIRDVAEYLQTDERTARTRTTDDHWADDHQADDHWADDDWAGDSQADDDWADEHRPVGEVAELVQAGSTPSSRPRPVCHVLCSNELLDNLPCGVVRCRPVGVVGALAAVHPLDELFRAPESSPGQHAPAASGALCWEELALVSASDTTGQRQLRDLEPFSTTWVPLRPGHWADLLAPLMATESVQPVPLPTGIERWFAEVAAHFDVRAMLHVDYGAPLGELQARDGEWLRTYRAHGRAGAPWEAPGSCDITADVPTDLVSLLSERAGLGALMSIGQSDWLAALDMEALVGKAREHADSTAAIGGLDHLRCRSVVTEAGLLMNPQGLGAFRVLTTSNEVGR